MTENWIAEMNEEDEEGIHSSFRGESKSNQLSSYFSLMITMYILGVELMEKQQEEEEMVEMRSVFGSSFQTNRKSKEQESLSNKEEEEMVQEVDMRGVLTMTSRMRCGGCGASYQNTNPSEVGFVENDMFEEAKRRSKLTSTKTRKRRSNENEDEMEEGGGWEQLGDDEKMKIFLSKVNNNNKDEGDIKNEISSQTIPTVTFDQFSQFIKEETNQVTFSMKYSHFLLCLWVDFMFKMSFNKISKYSRPFSQITK